MKCQRLPCLTERHQVCGRLIKYSAAVFAFFNYLWGSQKITLY